LISRPFPHGDAIEPHIATLEAIRLARSTVPACDSPEEDAALACAAHVFLQTAHAPRCLQALRAAFGESQAEHLSVFLAFVRTAHYWTSVHPELGFEDDIKQLLTVHEALSACVVNAAEASAGPVSQTLLDELDTLRRHQAQHEEMARTSSALRASEERFRMLADNMSQLAWTCDRLGNVTWYNQRWLDYTGLTFEDMKGWDWSKVQHPDHLERVVARVQRSAETNEPWDDTFPLRGRDGTYRWFLSRAIPIRDEHGHVMCWFGTNTDVTEQRAAEEALKAADRRKDEFLAMLAHELRNPLAAVHNAVQVLRRTGGDQGVVQATSDMLEVGSTGRRLARCEPHHARDDRAPPRACRAGVRDQTCHRSGPIPRAIQASRSDHYSAVAAGVRRRRSHPPCASGG
jgi:PAS domain S-box-containing protein